ncbi:MAG: adenylate/guanylate cyclase domain-containing protein, partial [Acidimicrobiales bacterium]|nr:adenylate/guanylate cyclase domain-containing protein [Acidimicrobiales bacterium]
GTLGAMRRRVGPGHTEREPREVRYEWQLELRSSPEQLWPLVADTNRFDRDAGTPAVEQLRQRGKELTNARVAARQRVYGFTLEYEQEPFEWCRPTWFSVTRRYSRGPLAKLAIHAQFERTPANGTRCRYEVRATPRNVLGRLAIPLQIGLVYQRTFRETFRRYDEMVQAGTDWRSTAAGQPKLVPGWRDRVEQVITRLGTNDLTDRFVELLADGDDLVVSRLRPYAIADLWGAPRSRVLELFLRATRDGLLAFRWDVLCPSCGGAKATVEHLIDLPDDVHCDTCNIDYSSNFERSVELTFRVTPAVRTVPTDEYCIGAPMATPHVVAQVRLDPDQAATVDAVVSPGRYRVRAQNRPGARLFGVDPSAPAARFDVAIDSQRWDDDEPLIAPGSPIRLHNCSGAELLVMVDRTPWRDDAVTAAEVIARQEFRDLFAAEALRPEQRISVGSMTVVFTDLRSSTELYRRVGDAVAFGHVLDHFDVLRAAIVRNGGSVVKTIGDAVMAVFTRPVLAVEALLEAQEQVGSIRPAGQPLSLKAGVHHGPCIAVTLNGRLDYFGTTVNLAARLESQAGGGSLVLSDEVRNDPEVAERLQDDPSIECTASTVSLKGFDAPVTVHRLSRSSRPDASWEPTPGRGACAAI